LRQTTGPRPAETRSGAYSCPDGEHRSGLEVTQNGTQNCRVRSCPRGSSREPEKPGRSVKRSGRRGATWSDLPRPPPAHQTRRPERASSLSWEGDSAISDRGNTPGPSAAARPSPPVCSRFRCVSLQGAPDLDLSGALLLPHRHGLVPSTKPREADQVGAALGRAPTSRVSSEQQSRLLQAKSFALVGLSRGPAPPRCCSSR
jgi:hypothetical protein